MSLRVRGTRRTLARVPGIVLPSQSVGSGLLPFPTKCAERYSILAHSAVSHCVIAPGSLPHSEERGAQPRVGGVSPEEEGILVLVSRR